MQHTIASYIEEHSLTLEAFGSLVGVQKSAVSKWINGVQSPSREAAQRIHTATNGQVHRSALRPDIWEPETPSFTAPPEPALNG